MYAKIITPRPITNLSLSQSIALSLLSETGLAAAAKASGQSVWASVTEQAIGFQAEYPANDGGKEKAFADFIDTIRQDANKAYLIDMAHGLGLDRFTTGPANAKEKGDNGARLFDRAMKKLDQYASRVNGAWAIGIMLTPGISTGKLETLKKEAKARLDLQAEAENGIPVHIQLRRQGESLAAAAAAVSGEGNALDAGGMAVASRLIQNVNKLIVAAALGSITIEQLDEIANITELATESAEPEAATLVTIPEDAETSSEPQAATA
jgi:hypothetical protein